MTAALGRAIPRDRELVALARRKLATEFVRGAELDRLARVLHPGERVVTLGDALFTAARREWRGLVAVTDERVICLDGGAGTLPALDFPLPDVTVVECGVSGDSGAARRGHMTIVSAGLETRLARINPSERAAEIAQHVRAAISG